MSMNKVWFYVYMSTSTSICVVLVCNKSYLSRFVDTYEQLRNRGKYKGDVTLVIGNDLDVGELKQQEKFADVNIIKFPDIKFSEQFYKTNRFVNTYPHITRRFQWHKLYLFDVYFKKWDYIFYMDCGMNIYGDIEPMLRLRMPNRLLAHSDSYPKYRYSLRGQFSCSHPLYKLLEREYNLSIDFFQTTMFILDTNLVTSNLFNDLYAMSEKYPISRMNDQGIIALYFTKNGLWTPIKLGDANTNYYDYIARKEGNRKPYIMLKVPIR